MADLIDKLRGIEISVVRANRALLGTTPVTSANELVRAAADRLEAQEALLREAMETLRFYADEGYDGYNICITDYGLSTENGPIITDGGKQARATLAKLRAHMGGNHE